MTTSDDRRPAAEAGRADGDGGDALDLDAIRRRVDALDRGWWHDEVTDDEHRQSLTALVATDVPALLAELAAYQRPGTPTYDQLLASHGQLLNDRDEWARGAREDGAEIERLTAQLAEVTRERDELTRGMASWVSDRLTPVIRERDEALGVLAAIRIEAERWAVFGREGAARDAYAGAGQAIRQIIDGHAGSGRDEARAKAVDGGEWEWGVRPLDGRPDQWTTDEAGARSLLKSCLRFGSGGFALIRRPVGPVEPVTDGEAAP